MNTDETTPILVTGAAGFIGFHIARRLLGEGSAVIGVDNLNSYYDPRLKEARKAVLEQFPGFRFVRLDIADRAATAALFDEVRPRHVVHMAAQAGVRYSITHPHTYVESNITGFLNILEGCRHVTVEHLLYASSSSVYGANTSLPFSIRQNVDHPISLYAATKKANELMAHTYSHLYRLPTTGLRFFTVYGPWGRPDMAVFRFTDALFAGQTIDLYNNGEMWRDFTYIDDVTEAVTRLIRQPAIPDPGWDGDAPDPATSRAPFRVYNIGNHQPVQVLHLVRTLERLTERTAHTRLLPIQAGDLLSTYAETDDLTAATDFRPRTSIEEGLARFVAWYRDIYVPEIGEGVR